MDVNLSVLNLVIIRKAEKNIPGMTKSLPGPKKEPAESAKFSFNLSKKIMSTNML